MCITLTPHGLTLSSETVTEECSGAGCSEEAGGIERLVLNVQAFECASCIMYGNRKSERGSKLKVWEIKGMMITEGMTHSGNLLFFSL